MPLHELFIVTLVGVTSGVYIYKPLLEKYVRGFQNEQKEDSSIAVAADEVKTAAAPVHVQKQE